LLASGIPVQIGKVFASSAGGGYITNPLPVASQIGVTPGRASFTDGFPPVCFQPGGYPWGQDFNGLLNMMTAWNQWQGAGGPIYYDSAFSSAIGGYPKQAFLSNASTPGSFWVSTVDNNTSDPDTGGANWISFSIASAGRLLRTNVFTIISGTQEVSINGAAFTSVGAGTWTSQAGTNAIDLEVLGGGGSGGGVPSTTSGPTMASAGGGAYGNYGRAWITSSFSGGKTVTVGPGGTAAASNANGGAGGTSSLGSLMTCTGGAGGLKGFVSSVAYWTVNNLGGAAGVVGGVAGATQVIPGAAGADGVFALGTGCLTGSIMSGSGASGIYGAGGPGSAQGGPAGLNQAQTGFQGTGYGSGSSGAQSWGQSASGSTAGQPGLIIIREYA
jgi:hypothetical protein